MTPPDALEASRALEIRVIGAEVAGIFWLGAELAILLVVLAARAYLAGPPAAPLFPRPQRQRMARWFAALGFMATLVLGRHFFWQAPHRTPALTDWAVHQDAERVVAAYGAFITPHHGVWLAFVTGWVLLEALIVWHGLHLYRGAIQRLRA